MWEGKKNVVAVGECRYSYRFISISISHAIYERANFWRVGFLLRRLFGMFLGEANWKKKGQSRLGVLFLPRFIPLEPCVILYSRRASEICFVGINPLFIYPKYWGHFTLLPYDTL
jgi:hypothetical protein